LRGAFQKGDHRRVATIYAHDALRIVRIG